MLPQKKNGRPLEPQELARVLHRETEDQQKRLRELEDALAGENYDRVSELVSSLDVSLSQHPIDRETQVLELRVMKSRYKAKSNQ